MDGFYDDFGDLENDYERDAHGEIYGQFESEQTSHYDDHAYIDDDGLSPYYEGNLGDSRHVSPERSRPTQRNTAQQGFPQQAIQDYTRTTSRSSVVDQALSREPRNEGQRIRLIPVSQLPDVYRAIFNKYGSFNAIQSVCFDDLMHTDENLVISAPTGSGKTVLFELAMIKLQMQTRTAASPSKCVYVAPTKALCSEKFNDWSTKFAPLGIKCCELTGDTSVFGRDIWNQAKDAGIIVTTGEKWDSLTRNWYDHEKILSLVHLFLVDEVHVLGESRGSTLEVVVSRMKMRGSKTRFILVSATVPNIDDIAAWIGNSAKSGPAKVLKFGEEFRPCKLARHVVPFNRKKDSNDFQFAKVLDSKLFGIIQQYSAGKPILVFVSTRKGVFSTAELLMREYKECESKRLPVPWTHAARVDAVFHDKRLAEFASAGIGAHHAGLTMEDRRATEQLYIQKQIKVLVTTSTLAVGVNLPAHLVIIKGVKTFQNSASVEYSDLDIMQMLGRAGRPQYDTEGVAVIMCESELAPKYDALTHGTSVLESSLHHNLAEHINSEIGLGTISSVDSAKSWLRESFLFQRLQKNPGKYAMNELDVQVTWEDRMDSVVLKSVEELKANQLVKVKSGSSKQSLMSTEFGEIMSKFYIRQTTMVDILNIPSDASLRELLETIARADEFADSKPRATEKTICNSLRKHPDIRFEIRRVETAADKAFVLIQAVLGGIPLNVPEYQGTDCQLALEAYSIWRHVDRIARAIVEVAITKKCGRQVKDGLELVRCLNAKAWEDRPVVLRQVPQLGEKSIKVLAENGITSLEKLREQSPLRLEALLNRRPGFGHEVLGLVNAIPRYEVQINVVEVRTDGGKSDVQAELAIECRASLGDALRTSKKTKPRSFDMTSILTVSSDMDFVDFRRIQTKSLKGGKSFTITVPFKKPSQSATVIISSEIYAGTASQATYKPAVKPGQFPIRNTKPCTALELDLAGLEEDPDFWNMTVDSTSDDSKDELRDTTAVSKSRGSMVVLEPPPLSAPAFSQPVLLPNGAYECNHPCKDKTACRHYCCKHGLEKPPPPPKSAKGKENIPGRGQKQDEPKSTSKVQRLHKSAPPKPDKRLQDLEKRHESANTSERLRLPSGQRLKIQSPETLRDKPKVTKSRIKPTFNLALSDLGESNARQRDRLCLDDAIEDDEDDLPDNVLDDLDTRKPDMPRNLDKAHADTTKRALSISSDESDVYAPKRRKTLVQIDKEDPIVVDRSPSPDLLFLPGESSEPSEAEIPVEQPRAQEDDIELYFDFGYGRPSPTPVNAQADGSIEASVFESSGAHASFNGDSVCNSSSETAASTAATSVTLEEAPRDNVMEEFEEWLLSGEVEIV
ncbi:Sec63 Brl domain-containing protein [Coprinopsis sp. MPI-PUGE-AT-0042]|nr:Sec63 Brl domain-containing protein [Coprinopsis sp. MPI-PUGE-AT-0042]